MNQTQNDELEPEKVDASLPTFRDDEHFIERHETFLKWIKEEPIGLLFLGDSITRRWVDNLDLWNQYFAQYDPINFGVGGDALQNVLWRIQNGQLDNISPKVLVLLIGTNNVPTNSGAEIAAAMRKVITVIRSKLPDTIILLHTIFPRGPQRPEIATEENPYYMDIVNTANKEIVEFADGDIVRLVDIGDRFLDEAGNIDTTLMPDQLHLVAPGYVIWGDVLQELLAEIIPD